MGYLSAMDMAAHAPLDVALSWHLQSNHYPPVNPVFIPVAKQAIEAGIESVLADDPDPLAEEVEMPNGIVKALGDIVEELHLDAFIEQALAEYHEEVT